MLVLGRRADEHDLRRLERVVSNESELQRVALARVDRPLSHREPDMPDVIGLIDDVELLAFCLGHCPCLFRETDAHHTIACHFFIVEKIYLF